METKLKRSVSAVAIFLSVGSAFDPYSLGHLAIAVRRLNAIANIVNFSDIDEAKTAAPDGCTICNF
jgi:hypothetical protein